MASSTSTPTLKGVTITEPSSSNTTSATSTTSTTEKSPWDAATSQKFESKLPGEYFDPCQEAANRSLKCLHRNAGDKEMCSDYFQ
ncbi:hypothetical protein BP6252_05159 [Coleophoma cylindrospora]|uniref:Uncharacterized protein n=1 Tax=Coleophoma cylindrospora TaxID=1849047 RepID=A0A3D8RT24_9HELO|nr:hypothetical protein BP6252_05159 [Coleophoma cylindrospora]